MKLEEIDPDVISLVTFTANDIAKTKGWATTLKPDEVKLVLQSVRLIGALQREKCKGKFSYDCITEK